MSDNIATPSWLSPFFETFYDPCRLNPQGLREIDGFSAPPQGIKKIFVNPPYSKCNEWVEWGIYWHQRGYYVVMLIPFESSTKRAKQLVQYGCERIYFEDRVYENVRGVELVILTGPNAEHPRRIFEKAIQPKAAPATADKEGQK